MSTERQRRIAELRPKVAARQAEQSQLFNARFRALKQEEARSFLTSFNSLEMLGFPAEDEEIAAPNHLKEKIFLSDQAPVSRIRGCYPPSYYAANAEDLAAWLQDCCQSFSAGKEYWIVFGEFFGLIRWAKIRVLDTSNWLFEIWRWTDFENLMALSADKSEVFFIYRDEDFYEAYLGQTAELLPLTRPPMTMAALESHAAWVKDRLESNNLNDYLIVEQPGQRAIIYDEAKRGLEWYIKDEAEHKAIVEALKAAGVQVAHQLPSDLDK